MRERERERERETETDRDREKSKMIFFKETIERCSDSPHVADTSS